MTNLFQTLLIPVLKAVFYIGGKLIGVHSFSLPDQKVAFKSVRIATLFATALRESFEGRYTVQLDLPKADGDKPYVSWLQA